MKVKIRYTNHRGETADRVVIPEIMYWGEVTWHPGYQWLLDALDVAKQQMRTFAMKDIASCQPFEDKP